MKIGKIALTLSLLISTNVFATAYYVPPAKESIIGSIQHSPIGLGDSVVSIAKQYDLGFNSLENANPHVNMERRFNFGTAIAIPTTHLLPNLPREGIVINLPEMRMYYYVPNTNQVLTFPIGIGKTGKTIPIVKAYITKKTENPTWIPPEDIREFNMQQGIVLPKIMPPGPDNPLGPYAIYTSIPTYLIHSTIFPESIGRRASFGCIRMYEADIKQFFPSIQNGTLVEIINAPVKLGWQNDALYMEVHRPLEEHTSEENDTLSGMVNMITEITADQSTLVDWQAVSYLSQERDGIPHDIGMKISN